MRRSQRATALVDKAARHWAAGEHAAARRLAARATRTSPGSVDAWKLSAYIEQNNGRLDEAVDLYRTALGRCRGDGRVEIMLHLGWCLKALDRLDDACTVYEACLAESPQSLESLVQCAEIHAQRGNLTESLAFSRAALSLPLPGDARGQEMRAMAQLNLMLSPLEPPREEDIQRLYEDLGRIACESAMTTSMFALGAALERNGEFTAAFETFAAANRLHRARMVVDMDAIERRAAAHLRVFDAPALQRMASAAVRSGPIVFVVGLPRSGSTLVESIIAAHPSSRALGEVPFVDRSIDAVCRTPRQSERFPAHIAGLATHELTEIARGYLTHLGCDASPVIDKYLDNFWQLGTILALFPDAKVIDVRKNPIDACLSIFKRPFAGHLPFAYDLEDCARYLDVYERLMKHWIAHYPDRIMTLRYEDLVVRPEPSSRALFDHLGLPWTEDVLDIGRSRRVIKTGSRTQLRGAIHSDAVEHWRRYRGHLDVLERRFAHRYPDLAF